MQHILKLLCIVVALMLGQMLPAVAADTLPTTPVKLPQAMGNGPAANPSGMIAPPKNTPLIQANPNNPAQNPRVVQQANQSTDSGPPKLNVCKDKKTQGIWRLMRVLETPEGARSSDLKAYPHQFVWMKPNKAYLSGKFKQKTKGKKAVKAALTAANTKDSWQYVMGDKGLLYVYKNQTFSHSYYCAIAAENKGIYKKGDMLLTPSAEKKSQLFELYRRVKRP